MLTHTTTDSPIGRLTLVNDDEVLCGIWMGDVPLARIGTIGEPATAGFERAIRELSEYFAGERRSFTDPIAASGNAFQRRAWRTPRTRSRSWCRATA